MDTLKTDDFKQETNPKKEHSRPVPVDDKADETTAPTDRKETETRSLAVIADEMAALVRELRETEMTLQNTQQQARKQVEAALKQHEAFLKGEYIVHLPESEQMLRFVFIPAGRFTLGYSAAEKQRLVEQTKNPFVGDNATPEVPVVMARGFFILDREATRGQFEVFKAKDSSGSKRATDTGVKENNNLLLPMTGISWLDAQAFCDWVQSQTGLTVRLPTELEWEYAARGPWPQIYPWPGDGFHAWAEQTANPAAPRVLKMRESNDVTWRGVFDMAGNVSEWCIDRFQTDLYRQLLRQAAETSPTKAYIYDPASSPLVKEARQKRPADAAASRTYRGGSFMSSPTQCEVPSRQSRNQEKSGESTAMIGFRPVLLFTGPEASLEKVR